jgi:hypothetical protein
MMYRWVPWKKIKAKIFNSPDPCPHIPNVDNHQSTRSSTMALDLPWGEQKWRLYVTNPVNTDEVWARLIGPEYSVSTDSVDTQKTAISLRVTSDYLKQISKFSFCGPEPCLTVPSQSYTDDTYDKKMVGRQ